MMNTILTSTAALWMELAISIDLDQCISQPREISFPFNEMKIHVLKYMCKQTVTEQKCLHFTNTHLFTVKSL